MDAFYLVGRLCGLSCAHLASITSFSIHFWPSTILLGLSCAGNTLISGYFVVRLRSPTKDLLAFLGTFGFTYSLLLL